jgi:tetratricopeptide (TPR) repeat protein
VTLTGAIAIFCVCAARPMLAEVLVARAHVAEALGRPANAIDCYRVAIRLDRFNALRPDLYERIGAIDGNLGRTSTVEYRMYYADLVPTQMDMPKAIAQLAASIPRAREPLAGVLRRRAAELLVREAQRHHYRDAYGAAVSECEQALALDNRCFVATYYLSRDYYLIGDYQNAIALTKKTLRRLDDPIVRADLCSNLGDAYTKINAFAEAKLAYRQSYQLDYILNFRALDALVGP